MVKRYIFIFTIFTYSLIATTHRDLMMMRTAVFGSIFASIYNTIKAENKDYLKLNSETLSFLYFKGKEFAPKSFLYDNQLSLNLQNKNIVDNDYFTLTSCSEFSIMKWKSFGNISFSQEKVNLSGFIYSITPLFRYHFKQLRFFQFELFFELGVGGSFMDNIIVENRNKSTQFQFNDNIGIGLQYRRYIFGYRFIHYSNLNIKKPNPSIDLHHIYFGFRF